MEDQFPVVVNVPRLLCEGRARPLGMKPAHTLGRDESGVVQWSSSIQVLDGYVGLLVLHEEFDVLKGFCTELRERGAHKRASLIVLAIHIGGRVIEECLHHSEEVLLEGDGEGSEVPLVLGVLVRTRCD